MKRLTSLRLKGLEIAPNLPRNATFHSSRATIIQGVEGVGFLEVSDSVDDIAAIRLAYFRARLPRTAATEAIGDLRIFAQMAGTPGMVLDFTGTGNHRVLVHLHTAAHGSLPPFDAHLLVSNFKPHTGGHVCETELDLDVDLAPIARDAGVDRLNLRAHFVADPPVNTRVTLLDWLRSEDGDLARRALPGIGSALRHNQYAAQLDYASWLVEIEKTLAQMGRKTVEATQKRDQQFLQLEQLFSRILAEKQLAGVGTPGRA